MSSCKRKVSYAVLIIYWNDIINWRKMALPIKTREEKVKPDFMFIIYFVVATIPAGVIGVLLMILYPNH